MAQFESLSTVSYSHSIATVAVFLAVSTQHTNVTDIETSHDSESCAMQLRPAAVATTKVK